MQVSNKPARIGAMMAGAFLLYASSATAMPITMEIVASSAPNLFGSPSANAYTANALNSLENGLGNIGDRDTDPTAYEILNGFYTAGDVMVTSGNSWRGQANPAAPFASEHGNRLHFGLHIQGDGATQFRLEDLTFSITSTDSVLDFAGNFIGLDFNCTTRYGVDWGGDNAKGGGDDTQVCGAGSGMTFVDELVYVGVGNAYWPDFGGVPDLQDAIDDTVAYLNSERPIIIGSYSIEGTDQMTYSATETLVFVPEPATLALFGIGLAGLGFARRRKVA